MSLQEKPENIKPEVGMDSRGGAVSVLALAALVCLAFMLGKVSVILAENHPVQILKPSKAEALGISSTGQKSILASRTGTKYYYTWCSGAGRIKDTNRIWFDTAAEAQARGYEKAANCPGE